MSSSNRLSWQVYDPLEESSAVIFILIDPFDLDLDYLLGGWGIININDVEDYVKLLEKHKGVVYYKFRDLIKSTFSDLQTSLRLYPDTIKITSRNEMTIKCFIEISGTKEAIDKIEDHYSSSRGFRRLSWEIDEAGNR